MNAVDTMTDTLKKRLKGRIEKATSVEELKSIMLTMVNEQPTIKSEEVKTYPNSIKNDMALMYEAFFASFVESEHEGLLNLSNEIDPYGLTSLKYIGKTKKAWTCFDCNKHIQIGSEAFRSFKQLNLKTFDKRYRCVSCVGNLVTLYKEEGREAIHTIAYHGSMPSHGQD